MRQDDGEGVFVVYDPVNGGPLLLRVTIDDGASRVALAAGGADACRDLIARVFGDDVPVGRFLVIGVANDVVAVLAARLGVAWLFAGGESCIPAPNVHR